VLPARHPSIRPSTEALTPLQVLHTLFCWSVLFITTAYLSHQCLDGMCLLLCLPFTVPQLLVGACWLCLHLTVLYNLIPQNSPSNRKQCYAAHHKSLSPCAWTSVELRMPRTAASKQLLVLKGDEVACSCSMTCSVSAALSLRKRRTS
jgi:hypothetical protein